jgi:hypothetical protein
VWPAFWLCSSYDRTDPEAGADGSVEIDVIEYYGHSPNAYSATMHVWRPKPHRGHGSTVTTRPNEPSSGFHDYGAMVGPERTVFYFDRAEVWRTPTPPEHNKPLMVLVNLALGSGWPIDSTPNPSYMYIDHVRVWSDRTGTPGFRPSEAFIFDVTLECDTPGASIHYTTDGSEPTRRSRRYLRPLSLSEPCTISARAYSRDYKPSVVASARFRRALASADPRETAPGLACACYDGAWKELPRFEDLVPTKRGAVDRFDLSLRTRDDHFGLAFEGFIDVPADGVYTFYTSSDDGSRLVIGEALVVDNDGLHGPREAAGRVGLMAGRHAIGVGFFEAYGGETLKVSWEGPGFAKREVPPEALSRPVE